MAGATLFIASTKPAGRLARRKAAQALGCAAIAVDHLQRLSRWRALAAHFHTGRVTAAIERWPQRPPSRHPEAGLLPPGTLRRTRWLARAHLAGFAAGLWTGAGRSYRRLE